MKKVVSIALIISFLVLHACTPSIGRRLIEKNKIETELSIGGSFFYYTPIPLPLPNVGLGLRYGIYENINTGVKVFPLLLTFNTLQITPYVVGSVFINSNEVIPSLNVYGEINSVIYLGKLEATFFPLIGVCGVWDLSLLSIYLPLEMSLDAYSERIPVKFNLGLGIEFRITQNVHISLELRLNSIGNIYLPLSSMVGIPVFFVSGSYSF
ncbi:MAG: hypothetical protein ACK4F9_05200 [Brevinematia bacterium]